MRIFASIEQHHIPRMYPQLRVIADTYMGNEMIELPEAYRSIEERLKKRKISGQQASDAVHKARGKLGPP
ncbi:hypothetical protein [Thalassovita autumnalis]|uniref:hypothetical protein n=2 Tax=Thalassovita autumnalis TaxID=2072972 RepID=UPI0010417A2A|nr:hypothetical protein [Thalassovita autumnalis]